jgi:aminoglycoside phosphotransferase (APT) family kinase protein
MTERIDRRCGVDPSGAAGPSADAAVLDDPEVAADLLGFACEQVSSRLLDHRLRTVHRRSGGSESRVFEASVESGGVSRDVLLVTHTDPRGFPEGAFVLEQANARVAVWRFPFDPYLPGLPSALDRDRVRTMLDGLGIAGGAVRLRTRSYRPSRRAVVEVSVNADGTTRRVVYLKVTSGSRAPELADRYRHLRAHVPVPRVVGVAADLGIVAFDALTGRTLSESVLTEGAALPPPLELLELSHRLRGSGLVSTASPRAFADPQRHVRTLLTLAPDLERTIRDVADAAALVAGPEQVVHGDLHGGQVLVDDGAIVGLLDVDGAGTGLLAHDAGSLVAFLQALSDQRPDVTERATAYADEVAQVYRGEVGRSALARATAGAWLALAATAQRSRQDDWPELLRRRVSRAAEALVRE